MRYLFGAVYVLVLATQLPHVYTAYANLEQSGLAMAHWTAWGAAVAFELATGVFTFRIVRGSRRRWTRWGLWFFIVASAVANATYYGWWPWVFDRLMPVFATVALPFALFLFAEEFGAEVKLAERRAKRQEQQTEPEPEPQFATKRDHIEHILRNKPDITQAELARQAGASASYVSERVAVWNRNGGGG